MQNILDHFSIELNNPKTNYFILDTVGPGDHGDVEFQSYDWSTDRFNKVQEGDLFIYRRPGKASELKSQFYFFGAGKIGEIKDIDGTRVRGIIEKPLVFDEKLSRDELDNFIWSYKQRKDTWEHFFNQYGMNCIHKADFINLIQLAFCKSLEITEEGINTEVEMLQQFQKKDYRVEDHESKQKVRKGQKVFADQIKLIYGNTCAITGIKTRDFLVASHIIPWKDNKDHRLDPQNGICLSTLVDRAFDKGYITISTGYKVVLSPQLKNDLELYNLLKPYEGKKIKIRKGYEPKREFLKWHFENVFKR